MHHELKSPRLSLESQNHERKNTQKKLSNLQYLVYTEQSLYNITFKIHVI